MREIEDRSEAAGVSRRELMENAGLRVAEHVREQSKNLVGMSIVVLVGPGNNGGDGLVAARHLDAWGARVTVCLCADAPAHREKVERLRAVRAPIIRLDNPNGLAELREALPLAQVALDAILGTGRSRPMGGKIAEALDALREARSRSPALGLLAVDLPSGVDGDSGASDPKSVGVDETLALGHPKRGLFRFPGAGLAGRIETLDIGIPAGLDADVRFELMTRRFARESLPPRPLDSHKGAFGKALIVGGSRRYVGAPGIAAMGAARVGAGLVTIAAPQRLQPMLAAGAPEPTHFPLPDADDEGAGAAAAALIAEEAGSYQALVVGPGLGQSAWARSLVCALLLEGADLPPTVIDADALNILAASGASWWDRLPPQVALTPHPGEMARLTGLTTAQLRERREDAAVEYASRWRVVVALKGAYTVVAFPDGSAAISPFANAAMATAGTGDALAGAIAGLLAQGLSPERAAALGVYLHGAAGELARAEFGDAGMVASDLLPRLPQAIRALHEPAQGRQPWRRTPWRT